MTRVKAADSNAYEVLGVSPKASAEEIDAAFHQLIEEGGYRIGVPIRGQWLRARQIKDAYAAVGDRAKRRAYDKSLKQGSEQPLWPATAHVDPAEAALVKPLSEWQPPRERTPEPIPNVLGSGEGERELAPVEEIEPGPDEIFPDADPPATWPEDDFSPDEINYRQRWGAAAAVTLAIGALFYLTWPSGQQLPSGEMAAQSAAGGQLMVPGAPTAGRSTNLPPAVEPDGLPGKPGPEVAGEIAPGADDVAVSVETTAASGDTVPGKAPAQGAASNRPSPGAAAATAAGGAAASTEAQAASPTSSGQTSTAAEVAAAPPAPLPPGTQPSASVAGQQGAGEVRDAAQWIGGGPTRSDNPRGRHVGSVVVQFTVQADGRVSNCGPVRSSGKADLDAFTCRLVEQRMRFKPALDTQGNPVASTAHARYEWGRRRRHPSLLSWIFR